MHSVSSLKAAPLPRRAASRPYTLQAAATAAYGKWGQYLRALIRRALWRVHPSLPGLGVGSGGCAGLLHILILTRLQDRGAHKPDPTKLGVGFANPILHHHHIFLSRHQLTRPGTDFVRRGCARVMRVCVLVCIG